MEKKDAMVEYRLVNLTATMTVTAVGRLMVLLFSGVWWEWTVGLRMWGYNVMANEKQVVK